MQNPNTQLSIQHRTAYRLLTITLAAIISGVYTLYMYTEVNAIKVGTDFSDHVESLYNWA